MTEKNLNQLNDKMDLLINLYAFRLVENMTQIEGAPILKRLGMTNVQIAEIYDTTNKSVSVSLAKAKRPPKKGK